MTKHVDWLIARAEAAHKDSEAHPEFSNLRAFYTAQAIAYENAASHAQGDGREAKEVTPSDVDLAYLAGLAISSKDTTLARIATALLLAR